LPLAKHLQDEGYDVFACIINRAADMELGDADTEKNADHFERVTNHDGLVRKLSLSAAMEMLKAVPDKEKDDWFLFFDHSELYKLCDKVRAMGYNQGLLPNEFYYRLEKDRKFGRQFAKKHYPDLKFAQSVEFTTVEEGIKHLEEDEGVWVLKSNGNAGPTVVPHTDDPEQAKEEIIDTLQRFKKDYESGGFLLEEKILYCLEIAPVMVFYDGEPVYAVAEFENKPFGAGNIGAQKGGNQAISIHTGPESEINRIAFPPIVLELAKKQPGLSVFDAGLLYDGESFYFTEFAAMRYGWDGIFSEIVMADDGKPFVGKYFETMGARENPLVNEYGAALRLFDYEGDMEDTTDPKGGQKISWDDRISNNLFLYSGKMKNKEIVSTCDHDFLGVITGAGDSVEQAVKRMYTNLKGFRFDNLLYRPDFDFLSRDYRTSIPNRITALERFL
jgi:phosphoribosylamine-glycine ligase